jgi:hypothetical protein
MRCVLIAIVCLAGCAHHYQNKSVGPPPMVNVHGPYKGIPSYLTQRTTGTDFTVLERQPVAGHDESLTRSQRLERIRANLAAVDALVAALGDATITRNQQLALVATAGELRQLLTMWPDIGSEADELVQRAGELGQGLDLQQPRIKQRMFQLTDLIRLQLLAAQ